MLSFLTKSSVQKMSVKQMNETFKMHLSFPKTPVFRNIYEYLL